VALLHARVAALLVEFMQLHPRLEIPLAPTNRRVDVLTEGFDIAIRARTPRLEDSSLVLREMAQRDLYLVGPDSATASVPHGPRLVTDDMFAQLTAAFAGLGVVQVPAMVMMDELRDGRPVIVLPQWCSKGAVVHAMFPSRRGLLLSVRSLIDFLAEKSAAFPHD